MVKYFRTVSSSIEKALYEDFLEICKKRGCSPHSIIKDYIEDIVEAERIERRNHQRNTEDDRHKPGEDDEEL